MKKEKQALKRIRIPSSPAFLFFLSALIITAVIHRPVFYFLIMIWLVYFYFLSIPSKKAVKIVAPDKGSIEEKYYHFLKLLDAQEDSPHDIALISSLKDFFFHETSASVRHTCHEYLLELIFSIIDSQRNNKDEEFNLDEWLKAISGQVLPVGTEKVIEYYVTFNRIEFTRLANKSHETPYLQPIIFTPPRHDLIPGDNDYPQYFQGKKFRIATEPGKKEPVFIKGENLWSLIHGNPDFFIKFDYSSIYSDDSVPFWLIPFAFYRWYSPNNCNFNNNRCSNNKKDISAADDDNISNKNKDNDESNDSEYTEEEKSGSFYDKFAEFGALPLHSSTRKNMFQDPLFWFLSSYVKESKNLSTSTSIANIATTLEDKFEVYCLAGLLQVEEIVSIDSCIFENIINYCINYLKECGISWSLSAFLLQKENRIDHLRSLLETECSAIASLSVQEQNAVKPYGQLNGEFKIDEKLIYEIKGEKQIAMATSIFNREQHIYSFASGISCLMKAGNYNRVVSILANYYLPMMAETGQGHEKLIEWWSAIENVGSPIDEKLSNEYVILHAVTHCLRRDEETNGVPLDEESFEKVGEILRRKWKTFAVRRLICSALIRQKNWTNYLNGIDAVPRDEEATEHDISQCHSLELN